MMCMKDGISTLHRISSSGNVPSNCSRTLWFKIHYPVRRGEASESVNTLAQMRRVSPLLDFLSITILF
jgi:hypothetical protein